MRYMYASAFDTNGLMRSAAKMFILCHAKSMASVFTMCIGIQEFASVLLLEPFSSPTMKKSHSRTFKPTNDLLHKEIARRSHFIIKEWESESTDNHPLLSAAGRVRAPEPKGWNTDRSTKWLAANGLKPSRQDTAFFAEAIKGFKTSLAFTLRSEEEKANKNKGFWQREGWANLYPLVRFIEILTDDEIS